MSKGEITANLESSSSFVYAIVYKRVIIHEGDTIADPVLRMSALGMAWEVSLKRISEALQEKLISLDDNAKVLLCFRQERNGGCGNDARTVLRGAAQAY